MIRNVHPPLTGAFALPEKEQQEQEQGGAGPIVVARKRGPRSQPPPPPQQQQPQKRKPGSLSEVIQETNGKMQHVISEQQKRFTKLRLRGAKQGKTWFRNKPGQRWVFQFKDENLIQGILNAKIPPTLRDKWMNVLRLGQAAHKSANLDGAGNLAYNANATWLAIKEATELSNQLTLYRAAGQLPRDPTPVPLAPADTIRFGPVEDLLPFNLIGWKSDKESPQTKARIAGLIQGKQEFRKGIVTEITDVTDDANGPRVIPAAGLLPLLTPTDDNIRSDRTGTVAVDVGFANEVMTFAYDVIGEVLDFALRSQQLQAQNYLKILQTYYGSQERVIQYIISVNDRSRREAQATNIDLTRQVGNLQQITTQMNMNARQAEESKQQLIQEIEDMKQKLANVTTQAQQSKQALQQTQQEIDRLRRAGGDNEARLKQLQDEKITMQGKFEEQKIAQNATAQELKQKHAQVGALSERLKNAGAENERLKQEKARAEQRIEEIRREREELKMQLSKEQQGMLGLREQFNIEVEKLKATNKESRDQLIKSENAIHQLQQRLETAETKRQADVATIEAQRDALIQQARQEGQRQGLTTQAEQVSKHIADLKAEARQKIEAADGKVKQAQDALAKAQQEGEALAAKIKEEREAREASQIDLEKTRAEANAHLQLLNQELKRVKRVQEDERRAAELKHQEQKEEINRLQEQLVEARALGGAGGGRPPGRDPPLPIGGGTVDLPPPVPPRPPVPPQGPPPPRPPPPSAQDLARLLPDAGTSTIIEPFTGLSQPTPDLATDSFSGLDFDDMPMLEPIPPPAAAVPITQRRTRRRVLDSFATATGMIDNTISGKKLPPAKNNLGKIAKTMGKVKGEQRVLFKKAVMNPKTGKAEWIILTRRPRSSGKSVVAGTAATEQNELLNKLRRKYRRLPKKRRKIDQGRRNRSLVVLTGDEVTKTDIENAKKILRSKDKRIFGRYDVRTLDEIGTPM